MVLSKRTAPEEIAAGARPTARRPLGPSALGMDGAVPGDHGTMRRSLGRLFRFYWGEGHRRRRPGARVLPPAVARAVRARRRRGHPAPGRRADGAVGRGADQPLPARGDPPRRRAARRRDARQLAAAARRRRRRDALDDVGGDRRHRALPVADAGRCRATTSSPGACATWGSARWWRRRSSSPTVGTSAVNDLSDALSLRGTVPPGVLLVLAALGSVLRVRRDLPLRAARRGSVEGMPAGRAAGGRSACRSSPASSSSTSTRSPACRRCACSSCWPSSCSA